MGRAKRSSRKTKKSSADEPEEDVGKCYCGGEGYGYMIQCDKCNLWVHGKCCGIKRAEGEALDEWFCFVCTRLRHMEANFFQEVLARVDQRLKEHDQYFEGNTALLRQMEDKLSQSYKENEGLRIALKKEQEEKERIESLIEEKEVLVADFERKLVVLKEEHDQYVAGLKDKLSNSCKENEVLRIALKKEQEECREVQELLKLSQREVLKTKKENEHMPCKKGVIPERISLPHSSVSKKRRLSLTLNKGRSLSASQPLPRKEKKYIEDED